MKKLALALTGLILLATLMAATASAQEAEPVSIPDSPVKVENNASPVGVIHEDVDQLGTRLAFRLKETFNQSTLFKLTAKDEPKIKVIVATKPEFPGRPQIGSVYSVVWIFSSGENVLTHYLASEAGTVDAATIDAAAEALAARTAAVAEQYAYLFE